MKKSKKRTTNITPDCIHFKSDWSTGLHLRIIPENTLWENGEPMTKTIVRIPDEYAAMVLFNCAAEIMREYLKQARQRVKTLEESMVGA